MIREALQEMERELSRRDFIKLTVKGAGLVAVYDRFGGRLFGQGPGGVDLVTPRKVYSALGNVIIPVDEDPGWATFEPDISDYGLNKLVKHVFFGGNDIIFLSVMATLNALNEVPPTISFGPRLLEMSPPYQSQYLGAILAGQFENDGVQDVLFLGAFLCLFSVKAVFFSNFPNHLAIPGAEYQVRPRSAIKTGWDIMGYKGPIGPEEEKQLREKFMNIPVLPGVDPKNPYI